MASFACGSLMMRSGFAKSEEIQKNTPYDTNERSCEKKYA